jgi:glucan phosphorylase
VAKKLQHQRHEGRLNGVLNMSILDGWYDEAAENRAAGRSATRSRIRRIKTTRMRPVTACWKTKLYRCSTRERQGVPAQWVRRVKQSLQY